MRWVDSGDVRRVRWVDKGDVRGWVDKCGVSGRIEMM